MTIVIVVMEIKSRLDYMSEPVATRPLAIQQSGTWYTYGLDLPKNVTELYGPAGYIVTTYTYSPYGLVTSAGSVTQYIQWSGEYNDTDLGLVYYNYRNYNPIEGRWINRDKMQERQSSNLYLYVDNSPSIYTDKMGMAITLEDCSRIKSKVETGRYRLSWQITKLVKELKNTCGLPSIECHQCNKEDPDVLGGFTAGVNEKGQFKRTGRLDFYVSKINSIEEFIGVIQHELIHAVQNCRLNRNKEIEKYGDCKASVNREIVAYLEGGNCRNEPNVRECVIQSAARSAERRCGNLENAVQIAREEYEKV